MVPVSFPVYFNGKKCFRFYSLYFLFIFFICLPAFLLCVLFFNGASLAKKFSRAFNFFVQKIRCCSIHCETSLSFCSLASQYRSRPCCLISIRSEERRVGKDGGSIGQNKS